MTTAEEWLAEVRGLDLEALSRLGVQWGKGKHGEAVAVPYRRGGEVYARKVRIAKDRAELGDERPFYWVPSGVPHGLFNEDCLRDETLAEQPIIITEGEFDALSVMESGFARVISIPDGWSDSVRDLDNAKCRQLLDLDALFRRSPCIIVAGDADATGEAFKRAVFNIFDGHPVRHVTWPEGCKDANDCLARHGQGEVAKAIHAAKLMDPPTGLITGFSDAPPSPRGEVYVTGDPTADRVLCCHTGFPTIVTGIPGHGKTTFATWALHHMQARHKIRVGAALMETPWEVLRDHLARLHTGRRWDDVGDKDALGAELDRRWRLLHKREADDADGMLWVRDMIRTAAVRDGCKIVAFDPWNEIEHRLQPGESMTEYTNAALGKMRQWAERYACALVVLVHPTKMQRDPGERPKAPGGYDISGSAAWYNKAAVGLTVFRDEDEDVTRLLNWKTKFEQLYPCRKRRVEMEFDPQAMVYRRKAA